MISIDPDKCTNCSVCSYVCPHGVIEMNEKTAVAVNIDMCIECGACRLNCPTEAISILKKTGCLTVVIKEKLPVMKKTVKPGVSCKPDSSEDSGCCC